MVVLTCLAAVVLMLPTQVPEKRLLFFGNSHTTMHNVPGMVKSLLEANDPKTKVHVEISGGRLLNGQLSEENVKKVKSGSYAFVVLQGAEISSSHRFKYTQEGGIRLAKLAKAAGSRPIFFAEWSRRGWAESEFIMNVYREIAKEAGGEVVPVCYAFDKAIRERPKLALWDADGNHSSLPGAYMAACVLYYRIGGKAAKTPAWAPRELSDASLVAFLRDKARQTERG